MLPELVDFLAAVRADFLGQSAANQVAISVTIAAPILVPALGSVWLVGRSRRVIDGLKAQLSLSERTAKELESESAHLRLQLRRSSPSHWDEELRLSAAGDPPEKAKKMLEAGFEAIEEPLEHCSTRFASEMLQDYLATGDASAAEMAAKYARLALLLNPSSEQAADLVVRHTIEMQVADTAPTEKLPPLAVPSTADPELLIKKFLNACVQFRDQGRYDQMLRTALYAEQISEALGLQVSADGLATRYYAGQALFKLGRHDEALKTIAHELACLRKIRPEHDKNVLSARLMEAICLEKLERYDEALQILRALRADEEKYLRPNDPDKLVTAHAEAVCLYGMGKRVDALESLDQSIARFEPIFGSSDAMFGQLPALREKIAN